MVMVFCRVCGKEIHDSAPTCPQCGAKQVGHSTDAAQSKWMALTSFILAILLFLASLSGLETPLDDDQILGGLMFGGASLALAIISLVQKQWGKGFSIAAIALTILGLLIIAGT